MMRTYTAAALAGLLLTAGLASAQQPPKPADGDKVMTLNREGQPPRRCAVLKSWKHPSGGTAYEVRAEDNGEVMTVIEHGPSGAPATDLTTPATAVAPAAKVEKPAPVKVTKSTKLAAAPAASVKASAKDLGPYGATKVAATSARPAERKADPLMSPIQFNGDTKVRKVAPTESPKPVAPPTQYTKRPIPAARRWFARMETPLKPMTAQAMPVAVVARYHADPVIRLIGALKDDDLPSLREVAAEELTRAGQGRSDVVEAMITAARTDLAPTVRACCCRCLATMRVKSPECLATLRALEADEEQLVRAEAMSALAQLEMK